MKGIVGFKIQVKEVQAAYKMNQNRNKTDYRNITERLKKEGNPDSKKMAELMQNKLNPQS